MEHLDGSGLRRRQVPGQLLRGGRARLSGPRTSGKVPGRRRRRHPFLESRLLRAVDPNDHLIDRRPRRPRTERAEELTAEDRGGAGHDAQVPDLRAAAMTGGPTGVIESIDSRVAPADVVVAHSGAGLLLGLLLRSIIDRLQSSAPCGIFVDAGIPPCEGNATPDREFVEWLRTIAVDGVVPQWSSGGAQWRWRRSFLTLTTPVAVPESLRAVRYRRCLAGRRSAGVLRRRGREGATRRGARRQPA